MKKSSKNENVKNTNKKEKVVKEEIKEEVKEAVKEVPKFSPKFKKTIIIVSICAVFLGSLIGLSLSKKKDGKRGLQLFGPKINVIKNESSKITYEDYNNGLISLKIPTGWKVEEAGLDYIHYAFKVTNPTDPNYMLFFSMKLEGFNKSESARNWQKKYYPSVMFAKTPVIDPQTTEAFYKVWNETASYVNTNDLKREYFPKYNDFTIIENLGSNPIGGDILRATYKDSSDKLVQGLFTASVKVIGTYYVNSNMFNLFSSKIDVSPLNVYNIIAMTAPDEEFNNWQSILDYSLSTLEFSEAFVSGFNKEETTLVNTIKANQKIYDSISDGIMDSWNKRQASYDIISQKQSDATLGYERVYDTDTGEIYKATNGFMDSYDGTKYQAITDDMYNMPTSGYIEKVG